MAYGGHQFGNWAGQLGDGRHGLGETTPPTVSATPSNSRVPPNPHSG